MRWASAMIESTTEAPPALVASPGRSQQNEDGRQLIATMRAIARRASSGSTLTSCSRSGERIAELLERGHLMERHSASARTGSKRLPGASLLISGAARRRRGRQLAPHLGPLERSGEEARPAPRDPTLRPVAFSACASGRRRQADRGVPAARRVLRRPGAQRRPDPARQGRGRTRPSRRMPRLCVRALGGNGERPARHVPLWWLDPLANSDGASALSLSVMIGRCAIARVSATRSPRREAAISSAPIGARSAPARRLEYRCSACGYGIVVSAALPSACPMCQATAWTQIGASRPKAR